MRPYAGFARLALLCSVPLTGCGTQYSLQTFAPTEAGPKTAFVDIKQRAVLSAARPARAAGGGAGDMVMCAEPSPDALSSFASELALDVKAKDKVAAQFALSQQEAASFVGLRSQSIQLLRDAMFRLCEGYMAGALSPADFSWLSRRYQRNMVALLTIEQLTRVAQVPTFAQVSQGMASASRSAAAIQGDLEEIDANRTKLEADKKAIDAELAEAEKLPEADASKAGKVMEIKKRQADKQAAITRSNEIRAALLEGLKTAKGILTSGSTSVQIISDGKDGRAAPTQAVADAIADITNNVILQDDLGTLCFQVLAGDRTTRSTTGLETHCGKIVENRAALDEEVLKRLRERKGQDKPRVQDTQTSFATTPVLELQLLTRDVTAPSTTFFSSPPPPSLDTARFQEMLRKGRQKQQGKAESSAAGGTKSSPVATAPPAAGASTPSK